MISLKNLAACLVAACGAMLILAAPWNSWTSQGLGLTALGASLMIAGLLPVMRARRQTRIAREQAEAARIAQEQGEGE